VRYTRALHTCATHVRIDCQIDAPEMLPAECSAVSYEGIQISARHGRQMTIPRGGATADRFRSIDVGPARCVPVGIVDELVDRETNLRGKGVRIACACMVDRHYDVGYLGVAGVVWCCGD